MNTRNPLIYPVIFALVLVPVMVVALITYQPNSDCDECECGTLPAGTAPHSHGVGLATTVQDGMQMIFNVSDGAPLYQVVDGALELCGDVEAGMKHVTLDVFDARLALGERLLVQVDLDIHRADSGARVVDAAAPAMYAPGHGYHFGDNFLLPPGASYDWTVTISPVRALRQEGAQNLWLEPVTWSGTFTLDDSGAVTDAARTVQSLGEITERGLHVMLGVQPATPLYEVTAEGATEPLTLDEAARYFVVDVTDHAVNYEEKLPGAEVSLTFRQNDTTLTVEAPPVISPDYGFHYGANVALAPGSWEVEVTVSGLDFLRHAGASISLARQPVSATFEIEVE